MIHSTRLLHALLALSLFACIARGEQHAPPRLILPGDYPDPSILRDGRDYYMTHSPFLYRPGFLIWHSTDLVHWSPVCRVMPRFRSSAMAPDLVKYSGKYYLYFPAAGRNWVVWTDHITGPWSDPVRLDVDQIDPGHAVGEDGRRYLFLSGGYRVPLSPDGLSVAGEKEKVYAGWTYPADWKTEGMYLESPKIVRHGGYFYLVSAEGGTAGPATSHMAVVARSKSINGPWENSPYNPLVHTYDANEHWWSQGHGTLIDDINGHWWIVYHAYEKNLYPLGRQTLLEPIEWTPDGWPRLAQTSPALPPSDPTDAAGMTLSDDFRGPSLGLQWTSWLDFSGVSLHDGGLLLQAKGADPRDARLLLVTATDPSYEVQIDATVPPGGTGGLLLFYNEKAFVGIASDGATFTLYHDASHATSAPNPYGRHFLLKIVNHDNRRCDLLASVDGRAWTTLAAGVDISTMHHNTFKRFLALRPALMAAGAGQVRFAHFSYKSQ